jgi:biotin-(acetyl-CoA carboxylase) ligase
MVAGIGVETATLLADGRVLLVGVGINTPLADLYWP